jgi:hypothetical protein
MGLSLDEEKQLENLKGYWTIVTNLQKVGYDIPIAIIKMLVLISGGAMVGILTFVGNLWTRNDTLAREVGKDIGNGMFWFGVALGLSLFSGFMGWMAYWVLGHVLAQNFFKGKKSKFRYVMYPMVFVLMLLTAAAVSAFLYGMYVSVAGLVKHI